MNKPTRRDLIVTERICLLKKYDELPKMGQRDVATALGIPQSSLCKLLKNRYELETSFIDNESTSQKRKCNGKDEDVENALKIWFTKVREKDIWINGPLLKDQAKKLARKMGKEEFKANRQMVE